MTASQFAVTKFDRRLSGHVSDRSFVNEALKRPVDELVWSPALRESIEPKSINCADGDSYRCSKASHRQKSIYHHSSQRKKREPAHLARQPLRPAISRNFSIVLIQKLSIRIETLKPLSKPISSF